MWRFFIGAALALIPIAGFAQQITTQQRAAASHWKPQKVYAGAHTRAGETSRESGPQNANGKSRGGPSQHY